MTLGVRRAGFPFCLEVTHSTALKPAAVDQPDQHSMWPRTDTARKTTCGFSTSSCRGTAPWCTMKFEIEICFISRAFSLVSIQRKQAFVWPFILYLSIENKTQGHFSSRKHIPLDGVKLSFHINCSNWVSSDYDRLAQGKTIWTTTQFGQIFGIQGSVSNTSNILSNT